MKGIILNSEQVNTILETGVLEYRKAHKSYPMRRQWFKPGVDSYTVTEEIDKVNKNNKCPFGELGDRLFVKETFCKIWDAFLMQKYEDGDYYYRASWDYVSDYWFGNKHKWKPATNMKQSQSRLTVEITDIKVEKADVWEWVVNLKLIK